MMHLKRVTSFILIVCFLSLAPVIAQEETPEPPTPTPVTEEPTPTEVVVTEAPTVTVAPTEEPTATQVTEEAVEVTEEAVEVVTEEPTPVIEVTEEPTPEATVEVVTPTEEPTPTEVIETPVVVTETPSRDNPPEVVNGAPPIPDQGEVRVIIQMNTTRRNTTGNISPETQRAQASIASTLSTQFGAQVHHAYDFIPYMAATVNQQALNYLRQSPAVASIQVDEVRQSFLDESLDMINVTTGGGTTSFVPQTGAGWTIAVLDEMPYLSHPFYADRVVAPACFAGGGGASSPDTPGVAPCSFHDHGTHVAGIAAGGSGVSGAPPRGVAPDANLMPVGVFTDGAGSGGDPGAYDSDILAGMNYVYSQRFNYNIAVVNMSLGGGAYSTVCDSTYPAYVTAAQQLRNANIAVVAAAGNEYLGNGMSAPACVSNIISVGALNQAGDDIAVYSNETTFLDLLAPGGENFNGILSSSIDGSNNPVYNNLNGTSMATPHVAGAFALLRERYPSLSVGELLGLLKSNGTPITSSYTDRSYRLIDLGPILGSFDLLAPTIDQSATSYFRATELSWEPFPDADSYNVILVTSSSGATLYDDIVDTEDGLSCNGTCTFTPEAMSGPAIEASVDWYVRALSNGVPISGYMGPGRYTVAQLTQTAPASAPAQTDVSGLLTYEWQGVPGAEYYQLYVGDTTGTEYVNEWITASAAGCVIDDTCVYQPDTPVRNGNLGWYVRPWKFDTYGVWSDGIVFAMNAPPPPAPTLNQPNALDTHTPQLDWTDTSGATSFRVYLIRVGGTSALLDRTYTRTEACGSPSATNCENIETPFLSPDIEYQYYVQSIGAGGGTWSTAFNFSLTDTPPNIPTNLDDTAIEDRGHVEFIWDDDPLASHYELVVVNTNTNGIPHQKWYAVGNSDLLCAAGRCSVRPDVFLINTTYTWYVRAWGPGGMSTGGDYSGYAMATIDLTGSNAFDPPDADNFNVGNWGVQSVTVSENIDNPFFVWDDIAGANYYELVITNATTGASRHQRWYSRLDVCNAGTCQHQVPDLYLTAGTYGFYVRAYGPGGMSINGISNSGYAGDTFIIDGPLDFSQQQPVITNVTYEQETRQVNVSWSTMDGATWMRVYLFNQTSGAVITDQWINIQNQCSQFNQTTCTRSVTANLDNGVYSVFMQGYGPTGLSDWSDSDLSPGSSGYQPFSLTVDLPEPFAPEALAPIPGSTFEDGAVTFSWSDVDNTTWYYLLIYRGSETIRGVWYDELNVCSTTCSATVDLPAGSFNWAVYSYGPGSPDDGNYPNSSPRSIVILE